MKRKNFFLSLIIGACVGLGGWGLSADCVTYSNSKIMYFDGIPVCAGFGFGCTECWDEGGGSCVTNGQSCGPFQQT